MLPFSVVAIGFRPGTPFFILEIRSSEAEASPGGGVLSGGKGCAEVGLLHNLLVSAGQCTGSHAQEPRQRSGAPAEASDSRRTMEPRAKSRWSLGSRPYFARGPRPCCSKLKVTPPPPAPSGKRHKMAALVQ